MRKLFIYFILFYSFSSCQKDDERQSLYFNPNAELRSNLLFNDTSGWEIVSVNSTFTNTNDVLIQNFSQHYGQPDYLNTFQKRSAELKITTIPFIKNNIVNGILRIYHTDEDSIRVNFFSLENINAAINEELATKDFQLYKGAIQSLIIVNLLRNISIDPKYINWLNNNLDRANERVRWYCIEDWDCTNGIHTSSSTGWSFGSSVDFNNIGFNLGNGSSNCILLSRECWIDWSPREFINNSYSGGNINWNNYIPGGGRGTGNTGSEGTGNDGRTPYEIKLDEAIKCMQKAGIKGIMAEAKLKVQAQYLCGVTYEELVIQCHENLIDNNGDCSDLNDVMDMIGELEDMVEDHTEWASPELKEYIDQIIADDAIVDPCNPNKSVEDIINNVNSSLCNEPNVAVQDFEEKLEEGNYLNIDYLPFNDNSIYITTESCYQNPPECIGCSVGEKLKAWQAHETALQKMECVISKLENFNINSPNLSIIHYLRNDFDISTTASDDELTTVVNILENLLKWIKLQAKSADYKSDSDCGPTTLAWTYPLIQATDIRLCNPNFFEASEDEQWNTMVHEWTHLYLGTDDIAYNWDKENFNKLSTPQAFRNADSYAEFIKHICP